MFSTEKGYNLKGDSNGISDIEIYSYVYFKHLQYFGSNLLQVWAFWFCPEHPCFGLRTRAQFFFISWLTIEWPLTRYFWWQLTSFPLSQTVFSNPAHLLAVRPVCVGRMHRQIIHVAIVFRVWLRGLYFTSKIIFFRQPPPPPGQHNLSYKILVAIGLKGFYIRQFQTNRKIQTIKLSGYVFFKGMIFT